MQMLENRMKISWFGLCIRRALRTEEFNGDREVKFIQIPSSTEMRQLLYEKVNRKYFNHFCFSNMNEDDLISLSPQKFGYKVFEDQKSQKFKRFIINIMIIHYKIFGSIW